MDTLGNAGLEVKAQLHLELLVNINAVRDGSGPPVMLGAAGQIGGGMTTRSSAGAPRQANGDLAGFGGMGLNIFQLRKDDNPYVNHRITFLAGERQINGLTDSVPRGALALQYSPMFRFGAPRFRSLFLGPEVQAELLFEEQSGAARKLGYFSFSVAAEFYTMGGAGP